MPMIKHPKHFDLYSWWIHLESRKVFVIIGCCPEVTHKDGTVEEAILMLLFKECDEPEWRNHSYMAQLRESGQIKCLMYRTDRQKREAGY